MLIHLLLPLLYSLPFLITFRTPMSFGQFVLGLYVGFSVLFIDRLLHIFFIDVDTEYSQTVRNAFQEKNIPKIIRSVLFANTVQKRLITRSAFFLVAYAATAIFVITSTGSIFGMGIILGIGLHYIFDFYQYRKNLTNLHEHFLWQMKRELAEQEVMSLFMAMCCFFLILTVLVFAGR